MLKFLNSNQYPDDQLIIGMELYYKSREEK